MPPDPECPPSARAGLSLRVASDLVLDITWTPSGLSTIAFAPPKTISYATDVSIPSFVNQTLRLLRIYFAARPVSFAPIPLDLGQATSFQRTVWSACSHIPWGQTRSYKWLASELGRPTAARPVGNALSKNPLPVVIPCHRVVRSDNSLGDFRYGTHTKRRLIALENPNLQPPSLVDYPR